MASAEARDPGIPEIVSLDLDESLWERVFTVAPLVVVATREPDGRFDLAPKHLAMPMGWGPWFGFVCAPHHATQRNAVREGVFTVSWPRPTQVVLASLTASPRCHGGEKPASAALPTFPARVVDGVLAKDAHLFAECRLERVVDGLGRNSLVIGEVVAAYADGGVLRAHDRCDDELVHKHPLLAYLPPGRFASIDRSQGFPFPAGFSR